MSTRTLKQPVSNPGFDKTIKALSEAGYRCARQFRCSDTFEQGVIAPEDYMELWIGPKGCVIVQRWTKGCGCDVYVNWSVGHMFEELKAAL